jgi:hypothetical protein
MNFILNDDGSTTQSLKNEICFIAHDLGGGLVSLKD